MCEQYTLPIEIWSLIGSDNYQTYLLLMQLNKIFNKHIKELESFYITYNIVDQSKSCHRLPLYLREKLENNDIILKIIKYDSKQILLKCDSKSYFIKLNNINSKVIVEKLYFNELILTIYINGILAYMIHDQKLVQFPVYIKYGICVTFIYDECNHSLDDNIDYLSELVYDQTSIEHDLCKIALHFANYDIVGAIMKVTDI